MSRKTVAAALICAASMMLFGAACDRIREQVSPRISDILSDPRKFDGKEVRISGRVTEVASIYRAGYFRVEDGSGAIVVVTTRIPPREGQRIVARGVVEQAYTIGQKQMIVVIEAPHRSEDQTAAR
jgi:cytochrome c-type biogenesis protein CcmE